MADITKYNGGSFISDFKTHFSIFRTKTLVAIVFIFIAFTIFLAFSNTSSPIFTEIFTVTNATTFPTSSFIVSDRSHFSTIIDYLFPNSSSSFSPQTYNSSPTDNAKSLNHIVSNESGNHTKNEEKTHDQKQNHEKLNRKDEVANQVAEVDTNSPESSNKAANSSANSDSNVTTNGVKGIVGVRAVMNLTSSPMKKQNNGKLEQRFDDLIKSLSDCDFYDGNWVREESYPLYKPNSCSLIDEQFNCFFNGRPDKGYYQLKWKPKGCSLPRLNGSHMLELLRGKRLVFVGDSLNRNMWESLICILKNSVKNEKVYEASGKQHFRSEISYSFVFQDYKCTVEFFATPFLVQESELAHKNGTKKETLRLDLISKSADKYKDAEIMVFNTGHWWTHDKTSKGKDYYQEGSHVYDELNVDEAFRKAMTTWGKMDRC